MRYKTFNEQLADEGFDELGDRLKAYMQKVSHGPGHRVTWNITSNACPIYLLGRYRKLARDVPQSPWTVSTQGGDEEAADDDQEGFEEAPAKKQAVESLAADSSGSAGAVPVGTQAGATTVQYKRKGRCSVEEIINAQVKAALQAVDCRMHPCGREDIDVRCLGETPLINAVLSHYHQFDHCFFPRTLCRQWQTLRDGSAGSDHHVPRPGVVGLRTGRC
jgi:hypothetical protein